MIPPPKIITPHSDIKEILGAQIATSHNLHFYINLMEKIRQEIKKDSFDKWSVDFLAKYEN